MIKNLRKNIPDKLNELALKKEKLSTVIVASD